MWPRCSTRSGETAAHVRVQALVETAGGLLRAGAIAAASPRLDSLILGYADLAASLGRPPGSERPELWLHAQETVLVAARASGLQAIDGPYLAIRDADGLRARAEQVRALGFDGKWAVHPEQLAAINAAFTPQAEEFDRASAIVAALEGAEEQRREGRRGARRRDDRRGEPQARPPHGRTRARGGARVSSAVRVGGPWFEDFERGQVFADTPGMTLTAGHAAVHQAVCRRPPAAGARRGALPGGDRGRAAAGASQPRLRPLDRAVHGADAARARKPLLPRPGARAPGVRGRDAAHPHRGRGAAGRTGAGPTGRRRGSWRCGSARPMVTASRCSTTGAAR